MANEMQQLMEMFGKSGGNPYLAAGQKGLEFLFNYMSGGEQRKQEKWKFGQQKDLYDFIRWNQMNQPAVSSQQTSMIRGNARRSLVPQRRNMLWRAGQSGGGMGSEQTQNMFLQNYLPIEARQSVGIDQWAQGMNLQKKQGELALLAGLTR